MLSPLEKITIMKLIREKSMYSTFGLIIKEDMLNDILNNYTQASTELTHIKLRGNIRQ